MWDEFIWEIAAECQANVFCAVLNDSGIRPIISMSLVMCLLNDGTIFPPHTLRRSPDCLGWTRISRYNNEMLGVCKMFWNFLFSDGDLPGNFKKFRVWRIKLFCLLGINFYWEYRTQKPENQNMNIQVKTFLIFLQYSKVICGRSSI